MLKYSLKPICEVMADCRPYIGDKVCIDYEDEETCTDYDEWDLANCRYSDDHSCTPLGKVIEACANGYCLAPSTEAPCNTTVPQCYW